MPQQRSPKLADSDRTDGTEVKEVMTEREIGKALGAQEITVRQNTPQYDSEALVNLESWEGIAELFDSTGVEVDFADKVLGDGFAILSSEEKHTLIGRPMALLEWRFNDGNQGRFVSIRAVVKIGDYPTDIRKVIINDGSTGILRQLDEFTKKTGKQAGLIVKRGLRVSEYTYEAEEPAGSGNFIQRPAKTFYFDASA